MSPTSTYNDGETEKFCEGLEISIKKHGTLFSNVKGDFNASVKTMEIWYKMFTDSQSFEHEKGHHESDSPTKAT